MRKTLAGIGALSLAALSLAYCSNDNNTGGTVDLAVAEQDLAVASPDMAATPADFATTTSDMATNPVGVPTEFVVLRIGATTRTTALNNDATAGFLERHKIADGAAVGNVLALPATAPVNGKQITFSGTASYEGQLSRSVDGKYLVVAGYAADATVVKDVSNSNVTTYNRVIARIAADDTIDTTTAFASYSTGVRGAATTDGTDFWVAGESGIGYTKLKATAVPTNLSIVNSRGIELFKNNNVAQLFVTTNTTTNPGLSTVGTGTPMTNGQTVTKQPGFTTGNSPSPYGFVAFDRDNNGSIDQLFIADDTLGTGGGIQRWKLANGTWTLDGTVSLGTASGARAVAGYFTGTAADGVVTLVATSAEAVTATPRVVQVTITTAANNTTVATKNLFTASTINNTYRGIALAPQ